MPLTKLFVEGSLDHQVLNGVFQGSPLLKVGGSKNALGPQARRDRENEEGSKLAAGYLRDRDFDFEPPSDLTQPTPDAQDDKGRPFGWRWCRHAIENYLLEPAVVAEATGWSVESIVEAQLESARKIRDYQAARWTVGRIRQSLPPNYELDTRPASLKKKELALPPALDAATVHAWTTGTVSHFKAHLGSKLHPDRVEELLRAYEARFNEGFLTDIHQVLIWFSGKDLLAGLREWLEQRGCPSPKDLRSKLGDWVEWNPDRTLELLPEWQRLRDLVQTSAWP